jgi:pyruvate dehydrogenase E2 component (dihydrolipoamide acetyltransferase)
MSLAWSQIPHVNSQDYVDVTRLEVFRRRHRSEIEALGGRLTFTVFALKAVAAALKAHPRINASLDTAAGEIVLKRYYHIGVAVNTAEGLVVPVVREVDNKSVKELAVELNALVQRAHARKISLEEFQGGTFTITNAGALGGWMFSPIINPPQVAILGMGQGRLQPAVVRGKKGLAIAARLIMPAVLCIDHRVLDGADAVNFLKLFKQIMEDPDQLLMSMV